MADDQSHVALVASAAARSAGVKMLLWLGLPFIFALVCFVGLIGLVMVIVGPSAQGASLQPTAYARQIIPPHMLALYQSESVRKECPELPWTVTAAIIHLESNDNRNPGTSSAGALGASQFIPTTWDRQGRLVVDVGKPFGRVEPVSQGYALDGDGDGLADIRNPADSVPATARLICANGGDKPETLPDAIYAYNHAWWYVYGGQSEYGTQFEGVLPLSRRLGEAAIASSVSVAPVGSFGDPGPGPQSAANGSLVPRAANLRRYIEATWGCALRSAPCVSEIGGYSVRPAKTPQDHTLGLALDATIGTLGQYPGETEQTLGWGIACTLSVYAEQLGVEYVIWDGMIWSSSRSSEGGSGGCSGQQTGWRQYCFRGSCGRSLGATLGHFDHNHVTVKQ